MTINRSTLLDLPLPVTGTEAGTWGDVTNNGLTNYLDIAIAGMNSLTSSNFTAGALTIALTEGDASATNIAAGTAQYATIKVSSLAQNSTITAPASARSYRIINADATYNLIIKATGQTGVTFLPGTTGLVAFNGTDYEIVGVVGPASATDNAVVRFDSTTGQVIQNSGVTIDDSNNVSGVAQLNATTADLTNIEVTNIKAKDGTAAMQIADSTGVMTIASSVLTTTDINGGTIDGTAIGANSASTGAFTTLSASSTATFAAGAVGTPSITTAGDTNTGIFFPAADTIAFAEGGVEAMRIDSSGNVGIGTSSPAFKLDVLNTAASATTARVQNASASSGAYAQYQLTTDSAAAYFGVSGSGNTVNGGAYDGDFAYLFSENTASGLNIGVGSGSQVIRFYNGGSSASYERMRIDSSGNVLVGTSGTFSWEGVTGGAVQSARTTFNPVISSTFAASTAYPSFVLAKSRSGTVGTYTYPNSGDRLGTLNFAGANTADAAFNSGAVITAFANQTWTSTAQGTYLTFNTTADGAKTTTERMRIDSSGRLLVGATSAGSTLTNTIELSGEGTSINQPAYQVYAYTGTSDTSTGYLQFFRSATTTLGANVLVGTNDRLGLIRWAGADGTNYVAGAEIYAEVDGTPGTSDMPGRIVFATTAAGGASTTERMRIDSSGNVGIGTSSPLSILHVGGGGDANVPITIAPSSGGNAEFRNTSGTGTFTFTTSNGATERMRIDSSGNLGLGVTPSAWGSIFKASQIGNYGAFVAGRSDSANQLHIGTNSYYNGTDWIYTNTSSATRYVQASGAHEFYTAASGTAGNAITFTQAMTLDASGNLLVGGTSQSGTANRAAIFSANKFGLSIIDTTAQTTGVGGALNLGGNYRAAGDAQAFTRIAALKENSTDNNYAYAMGFYTTPNGGTFTERMRIDSSGNVQIGTTTGSSRLTLAVPSATSTVRTALQLTDETQASVSFQLHTDLVRIATGGSDALAFDTNSAERMRIDSSGNLLLGGTATPASATASLAIFNGTAPTGSVTNGIILYAEDVSSSSELKVRDEAGNVTTLSPHNFSMIPEGPSEDMAWAYYSEKNGKRINVDMLKLARMVEKLTGEKLVYTEGN